MSKARPTFHDGGITLATQVFESQPTPELLIIETHDEPATIFEQLERLAEVCQANTHLFLLGPHNDVLLYRQLTRRGVREYIPLPADPKHLTDAIAATAHDPTAANHGRVISCIGATGGAGSSTMANNIAWCISKIYDNEVTLVDMDLVFGTAALDFNLDSQQTSASALAQADRLDDVMLERFLAKYSENLSLLTGAGDCQFASDVDVTALERLIEILRRNATWVVLDLPHYWGNWVRHALDSSEEVVVTAVPTLASLRNAKSIADQLNTKRKNEAPTRVVLNRIGANSKTDLPVKDFANALGFAPSIHIPHEPAVFAAAANAGHMIGEGNKNQRVLEPFNRLATLVSGKERNDKRRRASASGVLQRLLGRAAV
ncbi:MAG TPA: AAA family ATPase [Candidatus Cybelea sp.]|nr:AAA family ATPase [Candidatus Cybelea sp.]